jgi:hypothetical protein
MAATLLFFTLPIAILIDFVTADHCTVRAHDLMDIAPLLADQQASLLQGEVAPADLTRCQLATFGVAEMNDPSHARNDAVSLARVSTWRLSAKHVLDGRQQRFQLNRFLEKRRLTHVDEATRYLGTWRGSPDI